MNYAESHCLNTAKALQKVGQNKDVSAFCFTGSSVVQLFSGFDDGLILNYEFSLDKSERTSTGFKAFIGHMNKINSLIFEAGHLFSASQDCTVRQWTTDEPNCVKVFKFQDPITCISLHTEHNLLFTGSWDKIVRAINLKNSEVDRSFVASREAIKCLHLFDKWLFVAGIDPVIRCYDLTSGKVSSFEGHKSWVLTMTHYVTYKEDGETPELQWLISGSDDGAIRIWDIKTQACLDELTGHKNGVLCVDFANK